ncbi:hypothetical protein KJ359_002441 [Pestalotiopsis sp. 9143b]|nr:hypothetical protein KJ359_002441 [Pestalotiopsis sp. 9143b]
MEPDMAVLEILVLKVPQDHRVLRLMDGTLEIIEIPEMRLVGSYGPGTSSSRRRREVHMSLLTDRDMGP